MALMDLRFFIWLIVWENKKDKLKMIVHKDSLSTLSISISINIESLYSMIIMIGDIKISLSIKW
jgi:hypothetical protein